MPGAPLHVCVERGCKHRGLSVRGVALFGCEGGTEREADCWLENSAASGTSKWSNLRSRRLDDQPVTGALQAGTTKSAAIPLFRAYYNQPRLTPVEPRPASPPAAAIYMSTIQRG